MNAKTNTPGPWTAWDDDGTGTLPCVLAQQVTTFGNFYVAQCNVYEDARLVSAAPDLLDALRGAMFFVPEGTLARERGDAAINKAMGYTD